MRLQLFLDFLGTAFQAAGCGASARGLHPRLLRYRLPDGGLCVLVRGFHPRLWRYRIPDGWCECFFRACVPYTRLLMYCLPGSKVWCVSPGASPPVIKIPSSRREGLSVLGRGFHPRLWRYRLPDGCVRVFFPCLRSTYPVVDVLPSRQQGVVRVSGGFTPGYGDTVFQTEGLSVLSVHAFHILVMEVLPSRQQGVVRVSEGFTPGYRDTVFQTESCVCPGASPPVTEIPSSRRVVRVFFPCLRFTYPVIDVLPSRQQGVVRVSGGSTPGYGGTAF